MLPDSSELNVGVLEGQGEASVSPGKKQRPLSIKEKREEREAKAKANARDDVRRNMPEAEKFLMDILRKKVEYVSDFMHTHAKSSRHPPILVRKSENPGGIKQWFVIIQLILINVDQFPISMLERWEGDVDLYIRQKGLVYKSAVTLDLDHLTMKEVESFLPFLETVIATQKQVNEALWQCSKELDAEGA